jgi:uncharacterized protein (DUF885 family)
VIARGACAALSALLIATSSGLPAGAGGGDAAYAALAQRYFDESFADDPVDATATGVHTYDTRLPAMGPADVAARIARDKRYLERLDAIEPATLSPDTALDRTMLANSLRDGLLFDETMATWRHKPDDDVATIGAAVFSLIARNFAPAEIRLHDAIARENAVPAFVRQAEANLTGVDRDSAQLAVDDAAGMVDFLQTTVPAAFAGAGSAADRAALRASTARAAVATRTFATFVRRRFVAHPSGTYAIGAANYLARLKYEEGIDLPLEAYLHIGVVALAATRARMVAVARTIDPHATVAQVIARVAGAHHPTAAGLIPAARADLIKLRAFIVRRGIIDLPSDANITVTPTPEFERATTVAQMDAPGPLERVANAAYYNVTPPDPHDSKANQEAYLETFNDFERPIVSAHEVYPGHYTQFIINKHQHLSLTKKLIEATSFVEGWAHYDEQMVVDEGWGNGDPRVRLMQLKEAILRNARYVVGVKLHTQGMTVPQAERFFETEAFLDPADARIEARRGTQDATYGYYTLGKLEILKLRADYKKKMGAAFSLRAFHAALLAHGSPPLSLLRPFLLGADDDGRILPL